MTMIKHITKVVSENIIDENIIYPKMVQMINSPKRHKIK